jgi:ubiquitin fusion degradation protein 1
MEHELTYYSCLHKGDTICITHAGRQYMVNVTETKPDEQICVIETDLNTEFDPPLDYVEPKAPALHKTKSSKEREIKAEEDKKVDAIASKFTRLDGRAITEA